MTHTPLFLVLMEVCFRDNHHGANPRLDVSVFSAAVLPRLEDVRAVRQSMTSPMGGGGAGVHRPRPREKALSGSARGVKVEDGGCAC